MDFDPPAGLVAFLAELDAFITREIKPLEEADDNMRFFDHRREWARTNFDKGGLPRSEWEALLREAKRRADKAGHLRFALPKQYGGRDGSNLWMAVICEHFAAKGLGLHNDLQNEHSSSAISLSCTCCTTTAATTRNSSSSRASSPESAASPSG